MSRKKKEIVLDEFHYHEALDRTYVVNEIIENSLLSHPVFEKHKNLKEKVERAQELLCEVYQEIGGLQITLFPNQHNDTD